MTDREKLIQLLKQKSCAYVLCDRECGECRNVEMYDDAIEAIADYLLANGIIVPPCKVGDMVYRIAKDGKTINEERVGEIHLEFTIDDGTGWHNVWWLKEYNIGVTTFLTREDAERALKERKEDEGK